MSLFVKIECSNCARRDEYEVQGLIFLGNRGGKTLYYHHDARIGDLLNSALGPVKLGDLVGDPTFPPDVTIGYIVDLLMTKKLAEAATDGPPAPG